MSQVRRKRNQGKGRPQNKPTNDSSYDKDEPKLSKKGRDNDPNWYFTSTELAQQAAELSFQEMLGNSPIMGNYTVPTVMVFAMNPSPGNSYPVLMKNSQMVAGETLPATLVYQGQRYEGINLAARKLYTLLATYSGRSSSYGPQDVAMMLLAIGSVAELSEHIRRIFGLALTYNMRNRTMPLGLIQALGVAPESLTQWIADARMRFNVCMTRINQIPLVDNVGYIRKCRDLYQKVYLDQPSIMAQMYAMVPNTIWKIDEATSPEGTMLKPINIYGKAGSPGELQVKSIITLIDYLDEIIEALINSSTLNIIYSDIINLSSKLNIPMWQFDYLAENYVVMPEYNPTAILQFHNLDVVGNPLNIVAASDQHQFVTKQSLKYTSGNYVVSDPDFNGLIYNPVFKGLRNSGLSIAYHDTIVDMMMDNPSLEDRIEALRFGVVRSGYHSTWDDWHGTEHDTDVFGDVCLSLPDHYCTQAYIYSRPDQYTIIDSNTIATEADEANSEVWIKQSSQFANAPMVYTGIDSTQLSYITGDLEFFTTVDYNYLARINRIMYAGLFEFRV